MRSKYQLVTYGAEDFSVSGGGYHVSDVRNSGDITGMEDGLPPKKDRHQGRTNIQSGDIFSKLVRIGTIQILYVEYLTLNRFRLGSPRWEDGTSNENGMCLSFAS